MWFWMQIPSVWSVSIKVNLGTELWISIHKRTSSGGLETDPTADRAVVEQWIKERRGGTEWFLVRLSYGASFSISKKISATIHQSTLYEIATKNIKQKTTTNKTKQNKNRVSEHCTAAECCREYCGYLFVRVNLNGFIIDGCSKTLKDNQVFFL